MPRDRFFEERQEWSKYKHDILTKYVRIWVYKLGSTPPHHLAFIDACAGAGYYGEGPNQEAGSPLIAARYNDDLVQQRRRGAITVYACEEHEESVASLRKALEPYTSRNPPQAIVYHSRFEDVLPEILEATREVPSIFFIDPYGMESITSEKLRPLLSDRRRASTEILVRVPPILLARFAGWVQSEERQDQTERRRKTESSFRKRLEMYNINVDEVAQSPKKSGQTMELFAQYLKLFEDRFRYVQIIPIRPSYFAAPKYYLVHGTDSPHGAAKINDAVSTTEDSLFGAHDESIGQGSIFEPVVELRATTPQAKDFVVETLRAHGQMSFVEVQAELAKRFGPDLREKHHRAAVKQLLKERRIERNGDGEITEGTILRSADGF